jgi:hypothetical protein
MGKKLLVIALLSEIILPSLAMEQNKILLF